MSRGPKNDMTSSVIRRQNGASRWHNSTSAPATALATAATNQVP